ncbi:hypothetical protein [Gardnerella vaginalis]
MYVFRAEYVMKQIENGDTNWIKDGVEYSGGCIFGVNDTPSGNPVTMEVGSN